MPSPKDGDAKARCEERLREVHELRAVSRNGKRSERSIVGAFGYPFDKSGGVRLLQKAVAKLQAVGHAAPKVDANAVIAPVVALHHEGRRLLDGDNELLFGRGCRALRLGTPNAPEKERWLKKQRQQSLTVTAQDICSGPTR